MAFYFCRNYSYTLVWYRIYGLLAEIKDEEVENFFVDYLIEDDKEHPEIKKIIDKIFFGLTVIKALQIAALIKRELEGKCDA